MLDRRLEEHYRMYEEGPDSSLSVQHQNTLAPLLAEREYDHNSVYHNILPSISSHILDVYLQGTSPTSTHIHHSHPEEHSFDLPSHDIRCIHAQQALSFVNGAVTHHNQNGRLLLLPETDQRVSQHACIFYPHHQPPKLYHLNYDTIDPQLRPTQNHPHPPQPTGSASASSSPPTQHAPPTLSNSPMTRYTSPLTPPPAPQGNQAEFSFAHPAAFVAINSAMNPSKLAPNECSESCLCAKCCAAVVESDDGQEHSCETETENSTGGYWQEGLRPPEKRTTRHGPKAKAISKRTRRSLPKSRVGPSASKSARTKLFNDKLDAVNGVVIPSKLPPGTLPNKHQSKANPGAQLTMVCPRCKGAFGKRDHVKSHFAACVGRNGNPQGLRWDDGMPAGKFS